MDKDKQLVNNSNNTSLIFKDNSNKFFVFKKTEKISAALYMLSNLLPDTEPMKLEWRSIGLELLSESLNLSNKTTYLKLIIKTLSSVEIAYLGDLISEMNYNIFKQELRGLLSVVEQANWLPDSSNLILAKDFFEAGNIPVNNSEPSFIKDNNIMSDRLSIKKESVKVKDNRMEASNRQEIILSLLKRNNQLAIKDFVSAITGCSEKTVQRELSAMVQKGQIKKEGEKRWSRYSLK